MVGVEDEDAVHRAFDDGVDLVFLAGGAEHHVQEVARVAEAVLRVHVGLALAVFVGHGHEGGHFGDELDGGAGAVFGVMNVGVLVIEGRHGADQAREHGHGVGVAPEAAQEELHLLMHHGVLEHQAVKFVALLVVGQLAVEQEVAGVEVIALFGQLLDGVAAVEQLAFVAVDVGDGGLAGGGGEKAGVVGEHAGLTIELADVDHVRANRAFINRQFNGPLAVGKREGGFVF